MIISTSTSPYFVVKDFISPLTCENIVDNCEYTVPDTGADGYPVPNIRLNEKSEGLIYTKLRQYIPMIEDHYGIVYKGTERIAFEWMSAGCSHTKMKSENSERLKDKWVKLYPRDLTAVLFLCDYNDTPAFDSEFEVYGGKLEFPSHNFGFNPQRGTLVMFPSGPHFINCTAGVEFGDLYQARIQISALEPWQYDPTKFPGNLSTWFNEG